MKNSTHSNQGRQTGRCKKTYVPRLTPYRVEAEAKRQRPAGLCLLPLPLPFYSVNRKITVDGRWGDRGKAGREVGWYLQVWWWGGGAAITAPPVSGLSMFPPHCCLLMSGFSLSNAHWSLQFVGDMLVCSIVFAGGHTMSNAPDLF